MKETRFIEKEDNKEIYIQENGDIIHTEIPAGFYGIGAEEVSPLSPPRMFPYRIHDIQIPKSAVETSKYFIDLAYLDKLFSEKSKRIHRSLEVTSKVGYLLHGKQGSGKTTSMHAIAELLIQHYNAVCFVVDVTESIAELNSALYCLKEFQKHNPDLVTAIIMDECEGIMNRKEDLMKGILDGMNSPQNCVFLGATNYLDKIPETIKDRPSRFKYVIDMDEIDEEVVVYSVLDEMNKCLEETDQLSKDKIKKMVPELKGTTIDKIKNYIIDEATTESKEQVDATIRQIEKFDEESDG